RQCRSLALRSHTPSGIRRLGHGLQRFGGYGQGALRIAVYVFDQAGGVGGGGNSFHAAGHENRLPAPEASRNCVFLAWRDHVDADLGFLSRPCTWHPSLDSLWIVLVSALGSGQTSGDPVPSLFSGEPNQDDG